MVTACGADQSPSILPKRKREFISATVTAGFVGRKAGQSPFMGTFRIARVSGETETDVHLRCPRELVPALG